MEKSVHQTDPESVTPSVPADFRPISVTPILSRVMERMIVSKFIYPAFVDPPAPLSFSDQFAFKPAGSTTAALIAILDAVTTMLQTNTAVIVIALDFSKAFDTVRHSTLMEKMKLLDMPDCVYNWIVNFLTDHEHCTIYDGLMSILEQITASIIQGSTIGPASYSVNASDLRPKNPGNKLFKFADDTYLVIPSSNIDTRTEELKHVEDWASTNNLKLNSTKSQEIVFTKPRSRSSQTIPVLTGLTRISMIKILGVIISDRFSMEVHVSSVISSAAQTLYALKVLRSHGLCGSKLQVVFRATVLSKLQYASSAWWGFTNATQRGRLEAFLRRCSKAGFYCVTSGTFESVCLSADDQLFRRITSNFEHPLRNLLPPAVEHQHNLRPRNHSFRLPEKTDSLIGSNFMFRVLYKNVNRLK